MDIKRHITANKLYEKNVLYSKKSFELENLLPHRYVLIPVVVSSETPLTSFNKPL